MNLDKLNEMWEQDFSTLNSEALQVDVQHRVELDRWYARDSTEVDVTK